jgi:hypothetical protein
MNKKLIIEKIKQNKILFGSLLVDVITTIISVIAFSLEEMITPAISIFMIMLVCKNYLILFINNVFKQKNNDKELQIALLKQENEHLEELSEVRSDLELKYNIRTENGLLTKDMEKLKEVDKL